MTKQSNRPLFLYIGQNSTGTTSHLRAQTLRQLLPDWNFQIIDTHIPFFQESRGWRSLGFRFKAGPLIRKVNNYVMERVPEQLINICWVDKGIFLTPATTQKIRLKTEKLIHYTPDPAFFFHRSPHFLQSILCYDYLVTTKLWELSLYATQVPTENVIYCPQGFDPTFHTPSHSNLEKTGEIIFIGHYEPARATIIRELLAHGFQVSLAGIHWQLFYQKEKSNSRLGYLGKGLYGKAYSEAISSHYFGLGFLSSRFPELHTSRTFEIPACGTALICPKNVETQAFFAPDEAIFYQSTRELLQKLFFFKAHTEKLMDLTHKGRCRIFQKGLDYPTLLQTMLHLIS